MLPIALLIALLILTWAAAVVSVYIEPDDSDRPSDDTSQDEDYYDAA
jgi:Tfp pilus assembly protein PilW